MATGDLAALEDCNSRPDGDPPGVVLVTSRERKNDHARYLAVLPSEVDDGIGCSRPCTPPSRSRTFRCRCRGMTRPAGGGGALGSVLVAEDNRINQQVIERMLRSAGHTVTLVDDGGQALDALETGSFDIVLIDVDIAVMNGLDVVKLHRFATDAGESTPFIALTADATEETRRACEEAGMAALPAPTCSTWSSCSP